MKRSHLCKTAAILALAASALTPARAEDAPPDAAVVASFGVASFDKVKELIELAGAAIPQQATPAAIERLFPFIGAGKFQVDGPLGAAYVFGKDVDPKQLAILILPILPGGAPLTAIPNTVPAGAADTVMAANGTPFRRTPDYLMFGGTLGTTPKFDVTAWADAFKPSTLPDGKRRVPLFRSYVDLKAMKAIDAGKMHDWFVQNMGQRTGNPGNQMGQEWAQNWMEHQIDRFDLDLDQVGDDLALSMRTAPAHFDSPSVERPGLPDGCVLRADFRLSEQSWQKLVDTVNRTDGKAQKPSDQVSADLLSLVCVGDTESFGVTLEGDAVVGYEIVHRAHVGDLKAKLHELVDKANRDAVAEQDKSKQQLTEYAGPDGLLIQRLAYTGGSGPVKTLYIDCFTRGDYVYTALSASDHHFVEKLAKLKSDGKFTAVASGWVKPASAIVVLGKWYDPVKSADTAYKLSERLGDTPLQWSADNDGDGLRVNLGVPRKMIKDLANPAGGKQ